VNLLALFVSRRWNLALRDPIRVGRAEHESYCVHFVGAGSTQMNARRTGEKCMEQKRIRCGHDHEPATETELPRICSHRAHSPHFSLLQSDRDRKSIRTWPWRGARQVRGK
jgi:hypothetical protein